MSVKYYVMRHVIVMLVLRTHRSKSVCTVYTRARIVVNVSVLDKIPRSGSFPVHARSARPLPPVIVLIYLL